MESPRMSFFEHLEEFKRRALWIFVVFLAFFVIFLIFSIRFVELGGIALPYLWPDFFNSISVQVIGYSLEFYLPDFVTPVQIAPAEAILVQFKVAMFLAVVASMPMIVYQLAKFVSPGLHEREKDVILKITVPATLLFLSGVLISHFLILPFVFDFLYTIGVNIGFVPLARADPVFDIVLLFFVGMGLAFQTPVIMWGLTAMGLVDPAAYKKYWRYAVVAFFFFGAIITPDGSGITMMLVAVPMSVLYVVGYVLAVRTWQEREGPKEPEKGGTRRSSPAVWSAIILAAAVIVGFVVVGTPLLVPPGASLTPIASGTLDITLPAFVLYSAAPLHPLMVSGGTLTADGETEITYLWSGTASDGTPVDVAVNNSLSLPFNASLDGPRLGVFPARWTSENLDAIRLAVGSGDDGVYVLNLSLAYTVFEVGDRLLFAYEPTPTGAAFLQAGASTVLPPSGTERTLLERGRFSTVGLGPDWVLTASIQEFPFTNTTFAYTSTGAVFQVDGRTVSIDFTRIFEWSPNESHEVSVRGVGSADFIYHWYLDLRFGAIYPVLEAP